MLSPILQFKKLKKQSQLSTVEIVLAMLGSLSAILFWQISPLLFVVFFIVAGIWFFSNNLHLGIYALILTSFFHGLEINFADFSQVQQIPFLSSINAPIADLMVIVLCLSVIIAILLDKTKFHLSYFKDIKKGIILYAFFILSALVSVYGFMFNGFHEVGIKYLTRPILFTFIGYVLLPYFFIKTQKVGYISIIKTIFWLSFGIALFGFSSLFVHANFAWARIVPYEIFNIAPLGTNHNQLAEVLVALMPAGWFLYAYSLFKKAKDAASLYAIANMIIFAAAIFTLSRAAWLSVAVQVIISLAYLYHIKKVKTFLKHKATFIGILFVPVVMYMAVFLGSSIVTSSNSARIDATNIALYHAYQSPLFGQGPGSFMYLLNDTAFFRIEYGDPLDSHGVLQKIFVEEGTVGFSLFFAFFAWLFYYLAQTIKQTKDKALAIMCLTMVVGAVMFQLFNTSYFNSVMWLPIGLALGISTKIKTKPIF